MRIRSGSYTQCGPRECNEDAVKCFDSANVFALADGMGGLKAGDRASQHAIEVVEMHLERLRLQLDHVAVRLRHAGLRHGHVGGHVDL